MPVQGAAVMAILHRSHLMGPSNVCRRCGASWAELTSAGTAPPCPGWGTTCDDPPPPSPDRPDHGDPETRSGPRKRWKQRAKEAEARLRELRMQMCANPYECCVHDDPRETLAADDAGGTQVVEDW